MAEPRVIYQGSTEVVSVTVSSETVLTSSNVVSFSFDGGTTWKLAGWAAGSVDGKVREAALTVSAANLPTFPFDKILLVKIDSTIKPAPNARVQGRVVPT